MHNSEQKEVNEQFGRKMNEDVNENSKLFWKEVSNAKGGKVEMEGNRVIHWRFVSKERESIIEVLNHVELTASQKSLRKGHRLTLSVCIY